jgi:hypothetical protein
MRKAVDQSERCAADSRSPYGKDPEAFQQTHHTRGSCSAIHEHEHRWPGASGALRRGEAESPRVMTHVRRSVMRCGRLDRSRLLTEPLILRSTCAREPAR